MNRPAPAPVAPPVPSTSRPPSPPAPPAPRQRRGSPEELSVLGVVLGIVLLVLLRDVLTPFLEGDALSAWFAIFVSICIQALPFLGLGVLVSAAIAAFVPASWLARALPRNPALAVPVAGAGGFLLPGCECGAVPIAGGLVSRGVAPAAAFAFLLSAPAINPVVLVSTAVAFPGQPEVVGARALASFAVAVIVGLAWVALGKTSWLSPPRTAHLDGTTRRREVFALTAQHDFLHAGGFLVVGGLTAATMNVVIPREVLDTLAGNALVSLLTLAILAVILAICSEADAFVAASLFAFGPRAQLAFMVVGPAVDVKLIALQAGTFGRRFVLRFAPFTFLVALLVCVVVAEVLL